MINQGNCQWTNVAGRTITLGDTSLLHLSDIERRVLQKVALAKLQALNLGVAIRIPSESTAAGSVQKPKRRAYLLKRKAITTGFFDSKAGKDDKEKTVCMYCRKTQTGVSESTLCKLHNLFSRKTQTGVSESTLCKLHNLFSRKTQTGVSESTLCKLHNLFSRKTQTGVSESTLCKVITQPVFRKTQTGVSESTLCKLHNLFSRKTQTGVSESTLCKVSGEAATGAVSIYSSGTRPTRDRDNASKIVKVFR
ncbi:Rho GTPase-activating protein 6 [Homalodisca vitripennis]|nr:Rho GTPase-activating protein 6 [Homalodisca vitripennis]